MSLIEEKQASILETLNFFEYWEDKYNFIIELGENSPSLEEKYKKEEYLVKGCQSRLWLYSDKGADSKIYFSVDCDSPFPKGLAALIIKILNGSSPEIIIKTDITLIKDSGLLLHLSPIRLKGINALINSIKLHAAKHLV